MEIRVNAADFNPKILQLDEHNIHKQYVNT